MVWIFRYVLPLTLLMSTRAMHLEEMVTTFISIALHANESLVQEGFIREKGIEAFVRAYYRG